MGAQKHKGHASLPRKFSSSQVLLHGRAVNVDSSEVMPLPLPSTSPCHGRLIIPENQR